ncbi:unnamed protein product [Blepharisma stoltei]|uniref:Uncharacterized protein n=1 Tax=Blepharisma stoltei TaxID=1481888 RepID=A0AAU9JXZ7_9CILI|nr:unnamed protein product [Blepharisma stoltei]
MASSEEVKSYDLGPLPPIGHRNNISIHSFDINIEQYHEVEDEKEDNEIQFPRPLDIELWNGIEEVIIPEEDARAHETNAIFGFDGDEEIKEEIQVEISQISEENEIEKTLTSSLSSNLHASTIRDDRWLCPICLELFENPVETPCCHNLFCERCIFNIRRCPLCSKNLGRCMPNIPIRRLMDDLAVKCRHIKCDIVIRKADLINHEKECQMALVPCMNSFLCGEVLRRDLGKHLKDDCIYRPVPCALECGRVLAYCEMEKHLETDCQNVIVNCPQDCGVLIQRGEAEMHISQICPYTYIKCNLTDADGQSCPVRCMREELEEHHLICEFRKVRCLNNGCGQRISNRYVQDHDNACLFKEIQCPNNCSELILRKDIENHSNFCPLQVIECPYSEFGCTAKIERKNIKEHLEAEAVDHSLKMAEGCKQNKLAIAKMQFEMQIMKEMLKQEMIKIGDELKKVKGKKRDNERYALEWCDEEEAEAFLDERNGLICPFDELLRMLER